MNINNVNFTGKYTNENVSVHKTPFELYQYFRNGGEADRFVKSLDESIDAKIIKNEDSILCNIDLEDDTHIQLKLNPEKIKSSENQFEASLALLNSIIKKYSKMDEMEPAIKREFLEKIESLKSAEIS